MAERAPRRDDLPTGTVTLLFTDIEGSTLLLRQLGTRYADVQDRHRRLLRAAFAQFGGIEVDTQGDAFMVAFRSAADAAAAAVESQRALTGEAWGDDTLVPVRMGIHTGEPERGPEGYVGIDVVRAARICAVAHGGQIVVSKLTRDLLADAGLDALDLGSHRLKDLAEHERLFQLVADGLPQSFPPLRSLAGTALPALHHRLVGRQNDLGELLALLSRADGRLVTITGAGGAGKSRLALEVASAAAIGRPVHLVGLAPVSDPSLVLAEIARVVGAREAVGGSVLDGLVSALQGTRTLLFLDNLEHLTAAAHDVAALLDRIPDLDVLTTSRAPMRLSGERVFPLSPLSLDDAATLFVELAAARGIVLRDDTTSDVREICRRLDRLPLAIELVAARLVVLTPARVLQALDEGFALEMEGPVDLPERQRTLRATIAWSYGLLTETQRELQDALAVFPGGCTLDDAKAVAGAGAAFLRDLEALVAWSLVRSDVDGDVRLSMLETVREEALTRLAGEGTLEELRGRHARAFVELAREAAANLEGEDQALWLERLESELDNIRAALDWCFTTGRVEDALRATASLERFWRAHGHVSEARRWLALGLGLADDIEPDLRADVLWVAAQQATAQSDWAAAETMLEEARDLYRAGERGREEVRALANLSFVALRRNDVGRAERFASQAVALARELGDDRATSGALTVLGDVQSAQGFHGSALEQYELAADLRKRLGDPLLSLDATYNLGLAAFHAGDRSRARRSFASALAAARDLDEAPYVAAAQLLLAILDLLDDDPAAAEPRARESFALYTELEDDRSRARCLTALGGALAARGETEQAARLLGAAAAARADDRPDEFEAPILERCLPLIERKLAADRMEELIAEGRHARTHATIAAGETTS